MTLPKIAWLRCYKTQFWWHYIDYKKQILLRKITKKMSDINQRKFIFRSILILKSYGYGAYIWHLLHLFTSPLWTLLRNVNVRDVLFSQLTNLLRPLTPLILTNRRFVSQTSLTGLEAYCPNTPERGIKGLRSKEKICQ